MISLRCAATQPTIGHVPYELLSTCCPRLPSPIAVPDCCPGPKLPNPLSPCNQPPCNRRKSYRAKLDANQTVGFEAARVHALSSPRTLLVGRIRASGWFAACFRDARFESACVLTAGRQPYCHGRACPGGGDEGETIRRACKNPVNPILLGSASPLALQVRMGAGSHGAGSHDKACGLRSSVASVPRAPDRGLEECRSRFCFPAPASMPYTLRLKHPLGLSMPSLLTPAVNHEACAEGCFLGLLTIAATLRLRNRSRPCIAVNHAFTWLGPRSDASFAGLA